MTDRKIGGVQRVKITHSDRISKFTSVPAAYHETGPSHPLEGEEFLSTTQALVGGTIISFDNPNFPTLFGEQNSRRNNELNRVRTSFVLQTVSCDREAAVQIIAEVLQNTRTEVPTDLESYRKMLHQLALASALYKAILVSYTAIRGVSEESLKKIDAELKASFELLNQGLEAANLKDFILYCDVNHDSANKFKEANSDKFISVWAGDNTTEEEYIQTMKKLNDILNAITNTNYDSEVKRWNEVRHNWSLQDARDAISTLKDLGNSIVYDNVLIALTANLIDLKNKGGKKSETPDSLPSDTASELLTFRFKQYDGQYTNVLEVEFAGTRTYMESTLTIGDFSVPRKYLPTTLTDYFEVMATQNGEEVMLPQVRELAQLAKDSPKLRLPYLLMLFALKQNHPQLEADYEEFASIQDGRAPDMLQDKMPGKVWLTKEGKLRTTDTRTNLLEAFPIYISKAIAAQSPKEEPKIQPVVERETRIPENQIEPDAVFSYDFLGDIGILKDEDTLKYLDSIKTVVLEDPDELELEFYELAETYEPSPEKTLVFLNDLNASDPAIKRARQLGIDTVVVSGPAVTFVLSKDKLYSTSGDKKLAVGFSGVLDEDGKLYLDTEVEASQSHLILLNNIALELANRKVEKPQGESKDLAERMIVEWNRDKRGSLPRLERTFDTNKDVLIAIKTNSQTLFTNQS